ncbi:MAG: DUF3500 domain-containing protein [Chloroflexota bacterium]|nr:DUF3500 domain-containing protein [Chloroflexota bacterium]
MTTTDITTASRAVAVAAEMAEAAQAFVDSLDAAQRDVATFPFEGGERYLWHYTPVERNGLRLKEMTPTQRAAAFRMMNTALSSHGAEKAREIIELEAILDEWEGIQNTRMHWLRDPEIYYFSVFGKPGGEEPWGWRAGGHHIGIHATVIANTYVSVLPLFLGANPAEVRHGEHQGVRTLAEEEDLARGLLGRLDAEQKALAIVDPIAPDDILTKNYRVADPDEIPVGGITLAELRDGQRDRLIGLLRHYVQRKTAELAANEWRKIEQDGLDGVRFLWAGPEARGAGHYYALAGPSFVIEYDNTQNEANHIHSVMRSYAGDWGEDLLAAHYENGQHH